jgi:hypothetical protein
MNPDTVIQNAEDVKNTIETTIELSVHTKEDIDKVKEDMPKKVGVLTGAAEIHELLFEPSGRIKMKKLPNESLYKPVTIKVGKPINRRARVDLNQGFVDEPTVELEQEETEDDAATVEDDNETQNMRSRLRRMIRAELEYDLELDELEDDL